LGRLLLLITCIFCVFNVHAVQGRWIDDDIDGDGIPDTFNHDTDRDGIIDVEDNDMNGDGIPDTYNHDTDGNGIIDVLDDDDDNDGILDVQEFDTDRDGIIDDLDNDDDNDGIPDELDDDDDGYGILMMNFLDDDDDNDGILDILEGGADGYEILDYKFLDDDDDNDGIPDELDDDDDNDGIPDIEDNDGLDDQPSRVMAILDSCIDGQSSLDGLLYCEKQLKMIFGEREVEVPQYDDKFKLYLRYQLLEQKIEFTKQKIQLQSKFDEYRAKTSTAFNSIRAALDQVGFGAQG